jgi:hypothetical protein
MTGKRPTNSGMRPYCTRSGCSTSFSRCDMRDAFQSSCDFALDTTMEFECPPGCVPLRGRQHLLGFSMVVLRRHSPRQGF